MTYTKTNWQDRIVQKPLTYQLQDNGDGTITLIPAPGTVTQEGTSINAGNLNNLETQYELVKAYLGDNTSELWTQIKATDGAGSGLDAELFAGQSLTKVLSRSVRRDLNGAVEFELKQSNTTEEIINAGAVSLPSTGLTTYYTFAKTLTLNPADYVKFFQCNAEVKLTCSGQAPDFTLELLDEVNNIIGSLSIPFNVAYAVKTPFKNRYELNPGQSKTFKVRFKLYWPSGSSGTATVSFYLKNFELYTNKYEV